MKSSAIVLFSGIIVNSGIQVSGIPRTDKTRVMCFSKVKLFILLVKGQIPIKCMLISNISASPISANLRQVNNAYIN